MVRGVECGAAVNTSRCRQQSCANLLNPAARYTHDEHDDDLLQGELMVNEQMGLDK
jgi:hypothetical protein